MTTDQQDATPPPLAASYDSALEEAPDEPTPEELARTAELAVVEEFIAEQKIFHTKTAAWIMTMDHYKRIRAALSHQEEDPSDPWKPMSGDMHNGYPIIVVDGEGIRPHLELVDRELRPSYYAGVSSLGVERRDMKEPEFEAAAEESLRPGSEEAKEAQNDDAPSAS